MPKRTIGAAIDGSKEISDIRGHLITATFLALQNRPGHHDRQTLDLPFALGSFLMNLFLMTHAEES